MKRTWINRLRAEEDKPGTIADMDNARREAEYIARRNGTKPALLQLFKVRTTA